MPGSFLNTSNSRRKKIKEHRKNIDKWSGQHYILFNGGRDRPGATTRKAIMYITSQHYHDTEIVAAKVVAADYVVSYIIIDVDGEEMRLVVDGNHSLEAAKLAGVAPIFEHAETVQRQYAGMSAEDILEACWMDGDWIDAVTGAAVWQ